FADQGWLDRAMSLFAEAAATYRECRSREGMIDLLEAFARAAALGGNMERALCASEAATAARKANTTPRPPSTQAELDRRLAPARETLAAEEIERALDRGRAM